LKASDELVYKYTIRASSKIKSFAIHPKGTHIIVSLMNNKIEVFQMKDYSKSSTIELQGHRTDVRDVSLSNDDTLLLSTSSNEIKVWNTGTRNCIRTMELQNSVYGLCSIFVPGNKYSIVGTKVGELAIFDLTSGTLVESIKGHEGAIWSMDVKPDSTGFVTGSADKEIKFWEFELVSDSKEAKAKRLSINNTRTLKMNDEILCVKYSRDCKFVAASLLDNTVKVFYEDTLKFVLSLYGHKLPVMALDMSSDSTLIATGSADKNVKIWGLDFGDCHKSIFAHDDTITQIKFVHKTHYFFTCSKDRTVKYWDADKFEHIQTLEGHHSAIWGMTLSTDGGVLITSSQDRSLRMWERTDEQLFLEEEKEKQLEQTFESEETKRDDNFNNQLDKANNESGPASRRTGETMKSAEKIVEALEMAEEDRLVHEDYLRELVEVEKQLTPEELQERREKNKPVVALPTPNPLFLGLNASGYLLKTLKEIKSNDLEQSLLVMPFSSVLKFVEYLLIWIREGSQIELSCRCLFFLLKIHNNQLISNKNLVNTLHELKEVTRNRLQDLKDSIGFNRAALQFLKRNIELSTNTEFFEASLKFVKQNKKQKVK